MKQSGKFLVVMMLSLFAWVTYAKVDPTMDIDQARSQKWVSEEPTGFVKALKEEAKEYAEMINTKRRKVYEDVAKKTNTTPEIAGARAHQQIQEKLKGK